MGIGKVRLQNFRGFKDAGIELKPLTVLLGPNSAGKSSFGHALAALAHAHRSGTSEPSLTPRRKEAEEWPVDLGDTNDLRTTGCTGPIRIELTTSAGVVVLGFGGLSQTPELLLTYISHPSGAESLTVAPSEPGGMSALPTTSSVTSAVVPLESTIPVASALVSAERVNERQWQDTDGKSQELRVITQGLIVNAIDHTSGTSSVLSGVARDEMRSFLQAVVYLRANRRRPSRLYADEVGSPQALGYSGEFTTSVLHRRGAERTAMLAPPPLLDPKAGSATREWTGVEESLVGAVDFWMQHCELGRGVEASVAPASDKALRLRVTLEGAQQHDITEIGFGVSQVVPVLAAGLLQGSEGLLIVDLPEAHLHPRPQAALADFFCSLALAGKTTLVETHSEMFFHRLRLRAAQSPALLDKIAVYFMDEPSEGLCARPRPIGLRFEEELKWPDGFLQEAWEMETLISAYREMGGQ